MGLLPKEKKKINKTLEGQIITIMGAPKIGKSVFCSQMDKTLFLATEPGLNALEVYMVEIDSWERFLEVCAEIVSTQGLQFNNIAVDTIDNLFQLCEAQEQALSSLLL